MADANELDTNQKDGEATQAWVSPNELIPHTDAPDLSRLTGTSFMFGGVNAPGLIMEPGIQHSLAGRKGLPLESMVHLPIRD